MSLSSKCLQHMQEPLAVQDKHNSKVIINQATSLVDTTFDCRYFIIALSESVPLGSLQQHTCAKQDKEYTAPSTSASSSLSVALVVPLFHPIHLGQATHENQSQSAAPVSTWDQRTGDRMIVGINNSHHGPPPG